MKHEVKEGNIRIEGLMKAYVDEETVLWLGSVAYLTSNQYN